MCWPILYLLKVELRCKLEKNCNVCQGFNLDSAPQEKVQYMSQTHESEALYSQNYFLRRFITKIEAVSISGHLIRDIYLILTYYTYYFTAFRFEEAQYIS